MFCKKILLVLFTVAMISIKPMAQNKTYSTQWKKVEALDAKGLTSSALKEVLAIYQLAVKDNNSVQQIKSCLYQIRYRSMKVEDSHEKNIFFMDTLIAKATAPAKNILQNIQAEMFWEYLQNNRYKFYSRTKLAKQKSKDINTWDFDKIYSVISSLYKASLNDETLLKSTLLDQFDPILLKGDSTRKLRPTLFDFLAHRALNYFKTNENDVTKPAYAFTINNSEAFAPFETFIKTIFDTKDKSALHLYALELYKNLLHFHSNDKIKDALLDVDIERLQFVYEFATNGNKEALYEAALLHLQEKFNNNAAIAQAMFLRAKLYFDKSTEDNRPKNGAQLHTKRAKELCDSIIQKFPKSEGGINSANLLIDIKQPSVQLQTELVNLPKQPFRTLVTYKNVPTIYFKIIKTNNSQIHQLAKKDNDEHWKSITQLTALKNWQEELPDPKDFQQHAVEVKIDALDNGVYYLVASTNSNFSIENNILSKQIIHVSNIASINNNKNYYVVHRKTGNPIQKATVQVWESKYNYNTSDYENKKAEKYITDDKGHFVIKTSTENRDIALQITTATDELYIEASHSIYENNYPVAPIIKPVSFLFMDRSIYRPGQTIYFKGIVLQQNNDANKNKVLPNFKTTIQLKDANGQKIHELAVVSNEYGSYNGQFTLPQNGLNGNFSIADINTDAIQFFNVEEYKRPKFIVQIDKPTGTYKVNDSIAVTITAKGYAGNAIDGAQVKYRVVRTIQYPDWWGWGRRSVFSRGNEVEITNGTITTDKIGKSTINFKALPDESILKKDQPIFTYTVTADVTDINGETRSGVTSVAVAYQALQMSIPLPSTIPATDLKNILVKTTNLNDIDEAVTVAVQMHAVESPNKIFRNRYWEQADQFVMSKEVYNNYFPNDVYSNENEISNWKLTDKILDKSDSSNKPNAFEILNNHQLIGWYKITATTKDKYGELVQAEKYIQVTNNTVANAHKEAISFIADKKIAEPGQTVSYTATTAFDSIWLIHSLFQMNKKESIDFTTITPAQQHTQQLTVSETDRGGIEAHYIFVKNNQVFQGSESIQIPWSNKELQIQYSSFRDKLLPGQTEKYSVKITGQKGTSIAAEMMASMYDASLDQFKPHYWTPWNIWPQLYGNTEWSHIGFEASTSIENMGFDEHYFSLLEKSYDRLNYFERLLYYRGGKMKLSAPMFANAKAVTFAYTTNGTLAAASDAIPPPEIAKNGDFNFKNNFSPKHMKLPKPVFDDSDGDGIPDQMDKNPTNGNTKNNAVKVRKNFAETAFFFPNITADSSGNFSFNFTLPEALTKWKLQTLAHTKEAAIGYDEKTLVAQKTLMVQTNAPRFLREGDNIEFSSKIINLSDSELTGTATLQLFDAATNTPIDGWCKNVFPNQYFTVAAGQSAAVKFPMEIPFNFNSALTYRIVAIANNYADGEENAFPILTNRMLVTESMPINIRNTNHKDFTFTKLLNSANSASISNHGISIEYSTNPAWYAVQALPYLMEYPYECAEQTFNRFYANTLAAYITNSNPAIKAVFEKWKNTDTTALQSNLQKNEALKAVLLQETPWVLDAKNEAQQKQQIALLFNLDKMSAEKEKAFSTLKEMQSPNGGFTWFKGGPDDQYITQYILTGIGHLKKLHALSPKEYATIEPLIRKGLAYLDKKITEDYNSLVKRKIKLAPDNLGYTAIQYLYMRSFFMEEAIAPTNKIAVNYFIGQTEKYWLQQTKYMQGMIALAHHRFFATTTTNKKSNRTAKAIVASLQQNAIMHEELGIYWKEFTNGGYYWHQAPIESQALMIEVFTDIDGNTKYGKRFKNMVAKTKTKSKWKTTKATAEACYALLLQGNNWLQQQQQVSIQLGDKIIHSDEQKVEAGTGYFSQQIAAKDVQANMGNISVDIQSTAKNNTTTSWGAVYWQYFEDVDKITAASSTSSTPLSLVKKLFVEKNTDNGPVLEAIEDGAVLKIGSKVIVRIELKADRDMEYVHVKDVRAACLEPVNVLSEYKYQGGIGYYENTKDASTNFFISWLNRGTYVFEYPLFVTHTGNYSNGITSIQCMYAPEFISHSEGIRITVE